jgi:hypothetical protein
MMFKTNLPALLSGMFHAAMFTAKTVVKRRSVGRAWSRAEAHSLQSLQSSGSDYSGSDVPDLQNSDVTHQVFYVDTLSDPQAQMNVQGISKSYRRKTILQSFDYRWYRQRFGNKYMNHKLVQEATRFAPDLIHIGKGEHISHTSLAQIRENTAAYIIHFYGDYREGVRQQLVDFAPVCDEILLYHWDEAQKETYRKLGVGNIGHWWVGTDPDIFRSRNVPKEYDIAFFGNDADFLPGHKARRELLKSLAEAGFSISVFGNGWESLKGSENIEFKPFVDQDEFSSACSKARMTVGINAVNNIRGYASWRRLFNSMACGTMHMTSYFSGLEEVFDNGKHLVWFEAIEEAVSMAAHYLENDVEREQIAKVGQNEVVLNHNWDVRIDDLISKIPSRLESDR